MIWLKPQRDAIAGQMLAMLEDAECNGNGIDVQTANALINQKIALLNAIE